MKNPFNFEPEPLKGSTKCGCQPPEFDTELADFEPEEEFRGGRRFAMRGPRPRPSRTAARLPGRPSRPRPGRLKPPRVRPPFIGPWVPWPVVPEPRDGFREPYGFEPEPPAGSEYVRWVQDCLNQAMGLQLPVTGIMGPETRSAVRSFQRQQRLRASSIVGPDTEKALRGACRGEPSRASEGKQLWNEARSESELGFEAEQEFGSIGDTEVSADVKGALAQLPAPLRPNYESMGRLAGAIQKVSGPGLYLIMWNAGGKQKAYHGKAVDLKQRLMQHRLCAQMLGLSVDNHRVLVAKLPGLPTKGGLTTSEKATLRKREKDINTYLRNKDKSRKPEDRVFTNQRKELEVAVLGESWV